MFIARQRIIETTIYQAKCPKTFNYASTASTPCLTSFEASFAEAVSRQVVRTFYVLRPVVANSEHFVTTVGTHKTVSPFVGHFSTHTALLYYPDTLNYSSIVYGTTSK